MKNILMSMFVVLVGCYSCGPSERGECEVRYHTSGMDVCYDIEVKPEEVDLGVQIVEEYVRSIYPEVTNFAQKMERKNVSIYFIDGDLVNDCEKVENNAQVCIDIGGITFIYYAQNVISIYVEKRDYQRCLGETSFGHELLHVVEHLYLDVGIGEINDHTLPYFFIQDAERQGINPALTLEFLIDSDLQTFCKAH